MRAQTTLDFAIGISLFLITVAFVFSFVPGIIEPFETGPQEETVVADRVAEQLAGDMLGSPEQPYILDLTCTTEFFKSSPSTTPDCRFDQTTTSLDERVGVTDRQRLNVTLRADTDGDGASQILCSDGSQVSEPGDAFADPCGGSTVRLAIGETPPRTTNSVVVARRLVQVGTTEVTLLVRAW